MVRHMIRLAVLGLVPVLAGCQSMATSFFGPPFQKPIQEVSVPPAEDLRYSQPPTVAKFQRKTRIEKAASSTGLIPVGASQPMPITNLGHIGPDYQR
jgi:hypothetical protein